MTDKLKITIKIAEIEPIHFEIERAEEAIYRRAEFHVNSLWAQWKKASPERSSEEVFARIALAFAELYYRKNELLESQKEMLDNFESRLDKILVDTGLPQVQN